MSSRESAPCPTALSSGGLAALRQRIADNLAELRCSRAEVHDRFVHWQTLWQEWSIRLEHARSEASPPVDPSPEPGDRPMLSLLQHS